MSLTAFRHTVAQAIADAVGIDAAIVNGRVDGPVERGPLVCSWSTGKVESGDDANLEELEVIVRVLLPFTQQRDPKGPVDPEPLEAVVESVQSFTHSRQLDGGPWFWRPVEASIDVDARLVEFRCVGVQFNLFAQT